MLKEGKQRVIAWLMIGGLVVMFFGLVLWLMFAGGGSLRYLYTHGADKSYEPMVGFALLVGLSGAALIVAGLVVGLMEAFSSNAKKPIVRVEGCYVVGRYIQGPGGANLYEEPTGSDEEATYFVRMSMPGGQKMEFRCAPEVFHAACDGLRGSVVYQGNWLGQFVPERPMGAQAPQDPFRPST